MIHNRQVAMKAILLVGAALVAVIFAAIMTQPNKPKPITFDQRWGDAMYDIYGAQENLRRSGHLSVKTEIICTKKWCDPHPKGERR